MLLTKLAQAVVWTRLIGLAREAQALMEPFYPVEDSEIGTLDEGICSNNTGGRNLMTVGAGCFQACQKRRALLHFDLSRIPHGSTITSALLKLTVKEVVAGSVPFGGEIRRSTEPFWEEGGIIWEAYQCPAGDASQFPWCRPGGDFDTNTGVAWTPGSDVAIGWLAQDAVNERGGHLHLLLKRDDDH